MLLRHKLPFTIVVVLVAVLGAGCVSASTRHAVGDLAEVLRRQPGVGSVSTTVTNVEGNAAVDLSVRLAADASPGQVAALTAPLQRAAGQQLKSGVDRITMAVEYRRASGATTTTLTVTPHDPRSAVLARSATMLAIARRLPTAATVVLDVAQPLTTTVTALAHSADPVRDAAAALAPFAQLLAGDDVSVTTPDLADMLSTYGAPGSVTVERWHRLRTTLVALPGRRPTALTLDLRPKAGSIEATIDADGIAPAALSVARYYARLQPMITAQLGLYLQLGAAGSYALSYRTSAEAGSLVDLAPDGQLVPGTPPNGWNERALAYVRAHRR